MAENNEEKYIYVAFDTDCLSELAHLWQLKQKGVVFDQTKVKPSSLLGRYSGYFQHILSLIEQGKIRPFIVNTIYHESLLVDHIKPFIKEFGYFPDYNAANKVKKRRMKMDLARSYCKEFEWNGRKYPAPMKIEFDANSDEFKPQNDAYAMAEATIEGCTFFITANEKDYISQRGEKTRNSRAYGIMLINLIKGFFTCNEHGEQRTTKPMSIATFGALVNGIDGLTANNLENVVKASTVMIEEDEGPLLF